MPWSSIAESSGDSAVAVLRQGFGHARRGATTGAGLDVQTTAELPQLLSGGASSTGAVVE